MCLYYKLRTLIKYLKAQSQQLNYWFSHGSVKSAASSTATGLSSEYFICFFFSLFLSTLLLSPHGLLFSFFIVCAFLSLSEDERLSLSLFENYSILLSLSQVSTSSFVSRSTLSGHTQVTPFSA
jgi:hypothetical protein